MITTGFAFVTLMVTPALYAADLITEPPASPPAFVLKKGRDADVCKAYLKRLNSTDFSVPPYCGRPENTKVPGFAELNRVYLGTDEVFKLDRQVYGLLQHKDVAWWEKYRAERARLGLSVPSDERLRNGIELQAKTNGELQKPFRFQPPLDIDNDGAPDSLVMWPDNGDVCGETYRGNSPARSSTYAIILDSNGNVDASRTQNIFGHPAGGYVVSYKDRAGNEITSESKRFRPVGNFLGVVTYAGKTYFDTFYDSWGDIKNKRKTDPQIANRLALLKHEGGKTELSCEFLWKEPKK
jgi:hypothetical protein